MSMASASEAEVASEPSDASLAAAGGVSSGLAGGVVCAYAAGARSRAAAMSETNLGIIFLRAGSSLAPIFRARRGGMKPPRRICGRWPVVAPGSEG